MGTPEQRIELAIQRYWLAVIRGQIRWRVQHKREH